MTSVYLVFFRDETKLDVEKSRQHGLQYTPEA